MKTGKTLNQLAAELTRIQESKRDFVAPVARMEMDSSGQLVLNGDMPFNPNSWAHQQLASYTDIPRQYYEMIRNENPELLSRNVNQGFKRHAVDGKGKPDARMVRTVDGQVRAFLGSKYRRLDCHDLVESVLPLALESGMELASAEITEKKMYLQLTTTRLAGEVAKGDIVQHGLVISSSDVGAGSVRVEPMLYRLVCTNGLIMPTAMRKYHAGRNQAEDDVYELLTDKTRELTDAAFWAQVQDIVRHSLRKDVFEREIERVKGSAEKRISNPDLEEVVELTMKAVGVGGEANKSGILRWLASGNEGAGLTQWGLVNSFTRQAQDDALGYDDSIDMQRAAGKIIQLEKSQWKRIAEAV